MKTTITVEDGMVVVQVDDGQPVLVQAPISEKPVITPPKISKPGTTSAAPAPAKISRPVKPEAPRSPRNCEICGDDISDMHPAAKTCRKRECQKAKQREYNDRLRASKGAQVGVGRGNTKRKKKDAGPYQLRIDQLPVARLADNAPPAKTELRSKCHDAVVKTNDYDQNVCAACAMVCETYDYTPPFDNPWRCAACVENGRLCRLHASLEADGKKPLLRIGTST